MALQKPHSCRYSPCALYVGSTNDAILEDMKKAYMEQESKEKKQ